MFRNNFISFLSVELVKQTHLPKHKPQCSQLAVARARNTLHGSDSNQTTSYTMPEIHYTGQIQIRLLPTLCQKYTTRVRFKSGYFLHCARNTLHGSDSNQTTSYTMPEIHYMGQIHIRLLPTPYQTYITQIRFKSDYFLHHTRHTLHRSHSNQVTSYTVPEIHYTE